MFLAGLIVGFMTGTMLWGWLIHDYCETHFQERLKKEMRKKKFDKAYKDFLESDKGTKV